MSNKVKTPAELKKEQAKAQANAKAEVTNDTVDVDFEKENANLKAQLEEANRIANAANNRADKAETKAEEAKTELEKWEAAKTITKDILDANKDSKEPESLNHEYFVINISNKSLAFWGYIFKKWEKYAVTGRLKKVVGELVERKLWKIVKD